MKSFISKMFHLIAYRKTGKDYLVENLTHPEKLENLGWKVYGLPGTQLQIPKGNVKRMAFADKLKEHVCQTLDLPLSFLTSGEFELYKDTSKEECPPFLREILTHPSLREACIDWSNILREKYGKTYFVDLIRKDLIQAQAQNEVVFITDTRYPYEIFPNAISIRLFRKEVTIPPENILSEHSLDSFKSNFVLCKTDFDFLFLKEIQPQYKDFVCQDEFASIIWDSSTNC